MNNNYENRLRNNASLTQALKNLLLQVSKGRINIDADQTVSIELAIQGSDRDFNRCVNSLSAALQDVKVENRIKTSSGLPGVWHSETTLKSKGVLIQLRHPLQTC